MGLDRRLGTRAVLVTEMLAAAGEEIRRVIAELERLSESGRGAGDPGTADREPEI